MLLQQAVLDRGGGIDLVVKATNEQGRVSEYTFGTTFVLEHTRYRFSMHFSARLGPAGQGLLNYPQPAVETVIDRASGELRPASAEPGSSPLACETVSDSFAATAAAYFSPAGAGDRREEQAIKRPPGQTGGQLIEPET